MKVTKTSYGVQVKFTKEDYYVYYDGEFVSNKHIAFIPTESVRVSFTQKALRECYEKQMPFTASGEKLVSGKCCYNIGDVVRQNYSGEPRNVVSTDWSNTCGEKSLCRIYHVSGNNEFVQVQTHYALIMNTLIGETGHLILHDGYNMIRAYRDDIAIGAVILCTFNDGNSRIKFLDNSNRSD